MKRALVLSGGGSKGAFEAGAVDYLVNKAGLDFQIFLGTSAGALNVALLGQARNRIELIARTQQLKQLWLGIKGNSSIYNKSFGGLLNLFFSEALYCPSGLRRLLETNINLDCLFDPATLVKVTTVAIETGELFYADTRSPQLKDDFLKFILASASIPLFFPPVKIKGKHWYDGGLKDMTPLGAVFCENPDEIVVIVTYPLGPDLGPRLPKATYGGVFKTVARIVDILTSEIAAQDLQLAKAINRDNRCFPGKRQIPIRIIAPQSPLGQEPLDFNPAGIRQNMQLGYKAAQSQQIFITGATGGEKIYQRKILE